MKRKQCQQFFSKKIVKTWSLLTCELQNTTSKKLINAGIYLHTIKHQSTFSLCRRLSIVYIADFRLIRCLVNFMFGFVLLSSEAVWQILYFRKTYIVIPKDTYISEAGLVVVGESFFLSLLGDNPTLRAVNGIFVNRELLCLFPVNCEVIFLFLVKRDFGNRREPWFLIIIICETRIGCWIHRELWQWSATRWWKKRRILIWNFWSRPALWMRWRLLWWQWFCIRRRWYRASTSKQRTRFPLHSTKNKKRTHGEDIEQGSSLAMVLNQSEKNWSYKNVLFFSWNVKCRISCPWNVKRPFYFPRNVINTPLYHPLHFKICKIVP